MRMPNWLGGEEVTDKELCWLIVAALAIVVLVGSSWLLVGSWHGVSLIG